MERTYLDTGRGKHSLEIKNHNKILMASHELLNLAMTKPDIPTAQLHKSINSSLG